MAVFLKIFWMTILTAIVIGFITLSVVGIPSPSVNVKKYIPIETLIK